MLPINKVRDIISRHAELEKELSSGNLDKNKFASKSKEYSNLDDIIIVAKEYERFEKSKTELEILINDKNIEKDIKDLAKSELSD